MTWGVAREALEKRICLELNYDGFVRVVEVHAVGETKTGHVVMRVWQVNGGSVSSGTVGWKLLRLDEARSLALSGMASEAPRDGYKRGDRAIRNIYIEL